MGSTSIGRAWDSTIDSNIGGTFGDVLKDPKRLGAAVLTFGGSEVLQAADNKLFNDPRNKAEDLAVKAEAKMEGVLADQKNDATIRELARQRDLQRARTRSMGANTSGRSSTILTGPLGFIGGAGRNTLGS